MKKLSFVVALGFGTMFTTSAWAADCVKADCASLGYTLSLPANCLESINCPFDTAYKACTHLDLLDSCPAGKTCTKKYKVTGDEVACSSGYATSVAGCGTVSHGYYSLGAAQSTNASCKECVLSCEDQYINTGSYCSSEALPWACGTRPTSCDECTGWAACVEYLYSYYSRALRGNWSWDELYTVFRGSEPDTPELKNLFTDARTYYSEECTDCVDSYCHDNFSEDCPINGDMTKWTQHKPGCYTYNEMVDAITYCMPEGRYRSVDFIKASNNTWNGNQCYDADKTASAIETACLADGVKCSAQCVRGFY